MSEIKLTALALSDGTTDFGDGVQFIPASMDYAQRHYTIGLWSVAVERYFTIWVDFCDGSPTVGLFDFLTFTYSTRWPKVLD